MKVRAVLFDNDGTLIDSTPAILRCWARWGEEHALRPDSFDPVAVFGRPVAEVISEVLPADRVAAAVRRYDDLEAEDTACVLLPGTAEMLLALPRHRWAVVTSASRRTAEARLRRVGIDAPVLVTADDITRGKPDPEPFLVAAARLGIAPADCLVIEDAPAGLRSARAAGMRSIAVTTTHAAAELQADVVVSGLQALLVRQEPDGLTVTVRPPSPQPAPGDALKAAAESV
ncbi:HAD-IA family hydrolase [Actinacidiphila rubida]|uniref:Sugar-phosphatase n=1 Tax=Actinacidiphila rubida TaxID=310780 RepID=A0A1H8UZA6_9ACTN|nr:HAD-IA family hydrolase [Actinacidiphila rubida]SEP08317.1 sugar-phosphatase [Actinacidiphila rubida]